MNQWIIGDFTSTSPHCFVDHTKNIIIAGNLISAYDITFKVNHLIIIGNILTTGILELECTHFFHSGTLLGKNGQLENKISDEDIKKIKELGIEITNVSGKPLFSIPEGMPPHLANMAFA